MARYTHGMTVYGERVYVYGGLNGAALSSVEMANHSSFTVVKWQLLPFEL